VNWGLTQVIAAQQIAKTTSLALPQTVAAPAEHSRHRDTLLPHGSAKVWPFG
jgi:hypothetical protein